MAHIAMGSKGGPVSVDQMKLRSHWGIGFMTSGKFLIKPVLKHSTVRCMKIDLFTTGGRKVLTAARRT